jgi:coproporphyrinogen III oxidase-like Fe-S oxidoreductase
VQSFDDDALRFLRRRHDAARSREALHLLRDAGFSNIGIDLICGFDGQSLDQWLRTLAEEIALGFRTRDGVPLEALRQRPGWERTLDTLLAVGLVTVEHGRDTPTTEGLCVADRLAIAFAG